MSKTWVFAFLAALSLVGLGLYLGEAAQVLMNAATVCLSCMGIG